MLASNPFNFFHTSNTGSRMFTNFRSEIQYLEAANKSGNQTSIMAAKKQRLISEIFKNPLQQLKSLNVSFVLDGFW